MPNAVGRLALVSLARHHAISHALIQHCGGAEAFFIKFPSLDHEAFRQPAERNLLEPWIESGITSNINILEVFVFNFKFCQFTRGSDTHLTYVIYLEI